MAADDTDLDLMDNERQQVESKQRGTNTVKIPALLYFPYGTAVYDTH